MKAFERHFAATRAIAAPPADLFALLDRHQQLSAHMTKSSWMMGGGQLEISTDAGKGQKLESHVLMQGTAFGMRLFLDEVITQYKPPVAKVWETVGTPRLLVIGGYRMGFHIVERPPGSELRVFIDYDLPAGAARPLGMVLGRVYARWCVEGMLNDAANYFASGATVHAD